MTPRLLVAGSVVASTALVAIYLAAGGGSYEPTPVADPCTAREWGEPQGLEESAQQFLLSALDGAACELDVSREDVVLAFASRDSLQRLARDHGLSNSELEQLVRSSLIRAVDDAESADALDPPIADLLRSVARRIPIGGLLDLLDQLEGLVR
jgi:hypothetical protein